MEFVAGALAILFVQFIVRQFRDARQRRRDRRVQATRREGFVTRPARTDTFDPE